MTRIVDKNHQRTDKNEDLRNLVLDLVPLTDGMFRDNPTFADVLQRAALACLLDDAPVQPLGDLFLLARDLGYIDPEVAEYLQKQLRQIGNA